MSYEMKEYIGENKIVLIISGGFFAALMLLGLQAREPLTGFEVMFTFFVTGLPWGWKVLSFIHMPNMSLPLVIWGGLLLCMLISKLLVAYFIGGVVMIYNFFKIGKMLISKE